MSNCCNAKVIDPSGEGIEGVCADCGEHCEVVSDSQFDEELCEILTHNLKRAYFNGSTDVKARESGVIPNDTKLGEVMIQVLVAEAKTAILTAAEAMVEQVEMEAYDRGYDAGRSATPPKLVDAVEFRREQYGWSKGKMAAMLDMTKGNYSEFIHGTRGLPINSIRKAYAIGIPANVLLQDDIDTRLSQELGKENAV